MGVGSEGWEWMQVPLNHVSHSPVHMMLERLNSPPVAGSSTAVCSPKVELSFGMAHLLKFSTPTRKTKPSPPPCSDCPVVETRGAHLGLSLSTSQLDTKEKANAPFRISRCRRRAGKVGRWWWEWCWSGMHGMGKCPRVP